MSVVALAAASLSLAGTASAQDTPPVPVPISADTFTLTIFHNNDGESKLIPEEEVGLPGVGRFITLLNEMRAAALERGSAVITLSAGDNFLAPKDLSAYLHRDDAVFFDALALSGLYDALTLGNHDFDLGPDVTAGFIEAFDPPVPFVTANADFSGEPALQALVESGLLAGSTVVETGGERIGVIGAITPALASISSPRRVVLTDVLTAVQAEVERLESDGVNKIILTSHLQGIANETELVADLAGVDVVISGGGNDLLRNDGDSCQTDEDTVGPYPVLATDSTGTDVAIIATPGNYRCIGELTVVFDADGNIVSQAGRSVGVSFDVTPDETVQTTAVEPLIEAITMLFGDADSQDIATTEVPLDGRRQNVRTRATNQGNLQADALRAAATNLASTLGTPVPDIAIQNGGGIRIDAILGPGPISLRNTFDMAPFRNFVVVAAVPRETLRALLEEAVSRNPDETGRFAQISGFRFSFDPTAQARQTDSEGECMLVGHPGARVRDVVLDDGTVIVRDGEVVPGDPVVLATIDFLADGGDCYPLRDIEFPRLGILDQQAVADYLVNDLGGVVTAEQYPVGGGGRIVVVDPETGEGLDLGGTDADDADSGDMTSAEVTVATGDSLWRLAQVHLGSGARWREIYDLNVGLAQADGRRLSDPGLILVGWVLRLPA